jgi:hypothetical protein
VRPFCRLDWWLCPGEENRVGVSASGVPGADGERRHPGGPAFQAPSFGRSAASDTDGLQIGLWAI